MGDEPVGEGSLRLQVVFTACSAMIAVVVAVLAVLLYLHHGDETTATGKVLSTSGCNVRVADPADPGSTRVVNTTHDRGLCGGWKVGSTIRYYVDSNRVYVGSHNDALGGVMLGLFALLMGFVAIWFGRVALHTYRRT
ncbi:MAG TPA: hypothetical protein VF426_05540 [Marmoricola sp.]